MKTKQKKTITLIFSIKRLFFYRLTIFFSFLLHKDIENFLVIALSPSKSSYDLITNKFNGRFDSSQIILLDTFNQNVENFSQMVNLYPKKMTNLMEREIRIAAFNYKPYAILTQVVSFLLLLHFLFVKRKNLKMLN